MIFRELDEGIMIQPEDTKTAERILKVDMEVYILSGVRNFRSLNFSMMGTKLQSAK